MRRSVLLAAVATAAFGSQVVPAGAVVNGGLDGGTHPNVGGLVADEMFSDGTWIYCSGTMISPTVLLTAAHCAPDGVAVRVTFDTAYEDGDDVVAGTFHSDPLFTNAHNDPHDIAVVVLNVSPGIAAASLPAANSLAKLATSQKFTTVGYGAHTVNNGKGGKALFYDDVRRVATGTYNSSTPAWLHLSQNAAKGDGGSCYSDSGGPNFLGTGSTIASITITGDRYCRAFATTYRLDTASARAFLDDYVTLP